MKVKVSACLFVLALFLVPGPLLSPVRGESKNPGQLPDKKFTLSTAKLMEDLAGKAEKYPTYTTQLINLANRNSQATRSRRVGQMSELIQEFPGQTYEQWVIWYLQKHPGAIDQAAENTYAMIEKMRRAMADIDQDMVQRWIRELVLTKTYAGLRFQKSILKEIARRKNVSFRLATVEEESQGIDGYIGAVPVSVKPVTWLTQPQLQDEIKAEIIFYEKERGGIRVYHNLR